ncbi:hypothetical protein TNCV_3347901 [Trichonephila clavipes]|nr:hypothetical protein TNCV_3347901 [Trichonephila clavipes]
MTLFLEDLLSRGPWVAKWLEHRTLDREAWVRCHQISSEYTRSTCSLNQWIQKYCVRSQLNPRVQGAGEYFPPPPVLCLNCGGGDGDATTYRIEFQPVSQTGISRS